MSTRWVRPGRGVAVGVSAAITELQGDDRLGEVIVVVAPGATAATLRRLLPRVSGGVAGIRFLTPIDLAVELVDSSVSTMRAVTTQLQLAAITSVLSSDDCPPPLRGVRDHPATIDALVDMAVALRAAHVAPAALQSLAGDPGSVRSALIDVVVRARQRLAALGRSRRKRDPRRARSSRRSRARRAAGRARRDRCLPPCPGAVPRASCRPAWCRVVSVVPSRWRQRARSLNFTRWVATTPESLTGGDTHGDLVPRPRRGGAPDRPPMRSADRCRCAGRRHRHRLRGRQRIDVPSATSCNGRESPGRVAPSSGCVGRWPARCCDTSSTASSASGIVPTCSGCSRWPRSTPSASSEPRAASVSGPRCAASSGSSPTTIGATPKTPCIEPTSSDGDGGRAATPTPRRPGARSPTPRRCRSCSRSSSGCAVQSKRLRRASTWEAASKTADCHPRRPHRRVDVARTGLGRWPGMATQRRRSCRADRRRPGRTRPRRGGRAVHTGDDASSHRHPARCTGASTWRCCRGSVDRRHRRAQCASTPPMCSSSGSTRVCSLPRRPTTCCSVAIFPTPAAAVIEGPRAIASRAERAWNAVLRSEAAVTATFARTDLRRGGEVYPSPLLAGMPIEQHQSHAVGLLDGHPLTASEGLARMADPHPRIAAARSAGPMPSEPASIRGRPSSTAWSVPHPALAPHRQAVVDHGTRAPGNVRARLLRSIRARRQRGDRRRRDHVDRADGARHAGARRVRAAGRRVVEPRGRPAAAVVARRTPRGDAAAGNRDPRRSGCGHRRATPARTRQRVERRAGDPASLDRRHDRRRGGRRRRGRLPASTRSRGSRSPVLCSLARSIGST